MSLCFFFLSWRHTQFALKQTSCVSQTHITKDKLFKQAQRPELCKPASCAATWRAGIKVTASSLPDTKRKKQKAAHKVSHNSLMLTCVCLCVCVYCSPIRDTIFAFLLCFDGKVTPNGASVSEMKSVSKRTEIINDHTASFHGADWSSSRGECVTVCRAALCDVCFTECLSHWRCRTKTKQALFLRRNSQSKHIPSCFNS